MTREEKYRIMEQEIIPLERTLHQVVYRSLKRILGNVDPRDVEDVVQEVMKSAWKGLDTYNGRSSIKTWVYGIMKKKIFDKVREKIQEEQNVIVIPRIASVDDDNDEADLFEHISSSDDVLGEILRTEQLRNLMVALEKLNRIDRDIITMKYIEELSSKEIAEELGISVGNVDTRKHRAMKRWLIEVKKLEGGDDCE